MKKKIVISGIGCVCAIGKSVSEFCNNLNQLIDGTINQEIEKVRVAKFEYQDKSIEKVLPRMDKCCKMLLVTVEQALRDVDIGSLKDKRVGILIGSSYGVTNAQENYLYTLNKVNKGLPSYFQATTQNLLSGIIAYRYGLKGLNFTILDGWTSGLDAVILGKKYIENGEVDIIFAGGVDCTSFIVESYHQELLQNELISDNFYYAEGCGIVVLEGRNGDIQSTDKGIIKDVKQGIFYGKEDFAQELEKNEYLYKNIQNYYANENNTIYDEYEKKYIKRFSLLNSLSIKRYIGECGAASGILQMIYALEEGSGSSLIFNASCQGKYTYCLLDGGINEE